jgi:protein involved in polysaccharide export with SLBB domain
MLTRLQNARALRELIHRARLLSLLAACAMFVTARAVAAAQAQSGAPSGFVLAPGDVIRIEVWRNKELSGDFPIAADGSITHPLYRELKVTGLPLPAVEQQLRTFLGHFESNPSFVILPLVRVIVAGEVRQPNIYTVPPGTTVAQLIAMAGGPSDRGRLDRVQLIRRNGSTMLDITRPEVGAASAEVHSGDEIIIGRRRNIWQDVIGPSSGILAALASVTGIVLQVTRRH